VLFILLFSFFCSHVTMHPECIVTSLPTPRINYLRRVIARPFNG